MKDVQEITPSVGSLTIVNTVAGGTTIRLGSLDATTNNNAIGNYVLNHGNPDIYVWPISDSSKPYFTSSKDVTIAAGDYYSLFLGGTTSSPVGEIVKDTYQNYNDSIFGVRFVNMVSNSPQLNITISTSPTVNQFSNLNYRGVTDFKTLDAQSVNASYTFQVRNASTNVIIASVTMSGTSVNTSVPRFKNVTFVFRGLIGGSGTLAPSIIRVNHFQ